MCLPENRNGWQPSFNIISKKRLTMLLERWPRIMWIPATLSRTLVHTQQHTRVAVCIAYTYALKSVCINGLPFFFLHVAQSFTGYLFAHNTRITIVFIHLFGRLYRLAEKAFRLIVYFCCFRLDRLWCDHAMRYIQYILTILDIQHNFVSQRSCLRIAYNIFNLCVAAAWPLNKCIDPSKWVCKWQNYTSIEQKNRCWWW